MIDRAEFRVQRTIAAWIAAMIMFLPIFVVTMTGCMIWVLGVGMSGHEVTADLLATLALLFSTLVAGYPARAVWRCIFNAKG